MLVWSAAVVSEIHLAKLYIYEYQYQLPQQDQYVSLVDLILPLETWRFFITESGELCVRRDGTTMQDVWCVLSWVMIHMIIISLQDPEEG